MLKIDSIFLFIFIFSILGISRVVIKTLVSLFRNPPTPVNMTIRETIVFGFFISYTLTYILS